MTADTWIALASVLIAVCAFFLSIWQMFLSRKHDRLSAMPHLLISFHTKETPPRFGIYLENAGIGPAIIKSFEVFLDGHNQEPFEHTAWLAIVDLLELDGEVTGMTIDPGEYFQVGKSCVLLSFKSKNSKLTLRQMRQTLQRLQIKIKYASIFGDAQTAEFEVPDSIFDCFNTEDGKI